MTSGAGPQIPDPNRFLVGTLDFSWRTGPRGCVNGSPGGVLCMALATSHQGLSSFPGIQHLPGLSRLSVSRESLRQLL